MHGSDNFRELFCSWWEDKTYVDVVSEEGVNQRTPKVWYIGQCAYCGLLVRDEFSFCPNCGKARPTARFCTNCGEKLSPNAKFCPNCGTKVE